MPIEHIVVIQTPAGPVVKKILALNTGDVNEQIDRLIDAQLLPEGSYLQSASAVPTPQTSGSTAGFDSDWNRVAGVVQGFGLADATSDMLKSLPIFNPAGFQGVGGGEGAVQENLEAAVPASIFRNWLRERQGIGSTQMPMAAGSGYAQGLGEKAGLLGSIAQAYGSALPDSEAIPDATAGFRGFLGSVGDVMTEGGLGMGQAFGNVAQEMLSGIGGMGMAPLAGLGEYASPGSAGADQAREVNALADAALRNRMGVLGQARFGGRIVDEAAQRFWDQYAQSGIQPGSYANWMLQKTGGV